MIKMILVFKWSGESFEPLTISRQEFHQLLMRWHVEQRIVNLISHILDVAMPVLVDDATTHEPILQFVDVNVDWNF